ncbi:MAG: hypothetical protein IT450_09550 [Phycisphaerales bacterium]|nr:hypothetical protein [Phycisphaerales bacterium]
MRAICLFASAVLFLMSPGLVKRAEAQCSTVDFDNLANGTVVTNQYSGVTISGRDPDGTAGVNPIIYSPSGGTTSGSRCLSAFGDGINEFSPEFLRLDFARDQTSVTFNLGVRVGCVASDTVSVRIYSLDGGNYNIRRIIPVPVNGTLSSPRVLVFVRAERTTGDPFRRIEIEAGNPCAERYELIDDLTYDIDITPPVAAIDTPSSCVCNGTSITGSAYDPDAGISGWQLHRRKRGEANWVLIRSSGTEIFNGELGPWTTSGGDGDYTLRLRVTNECGLETEAFTDVYMDRALNSLAVRSPVANAIIGGALCVDGTAWDHCGGDFSVEHRPAGAAAWAIFDSVNPPWVVNDPLASWNTRVGTSDGGYEVRVTAIDDCGNTATSPVIPITVDNTRPIAAITSPANCVAVNGIVEIRGIVNDPHLRDWALYYTGGDAHGWVPVPGAGGAANINGVLANWDTTDLRPCCYTLRLLARDQAIVDCGATQGNQAEFLVSVTVGEAAACPGDISGDGQIDIADLALLLAAFGQTCP